MPAETHGPAADPVVRHGTDKGLACPRCGCRHLFVVYTRPADARRIMRRRECRHCGRRVVTYEVLLA